jgi:hypothetical protein
VISWTLRALLGAVNGIAQRGEDVGAVFTSVVTRRVVIADGEGERVAGVDVAETVTHHGGAADVGSALPDNLGEVAPLLEVGHAGVGLTVGGGEVFDLVVVHQIGDHDTNFAGLDTVADVLAVTAAINGAGMMLVWVLILWFVIGNLRIVLVNTLGGKSASARLEIGRPVDRSSGVVAAMDVVVVQDGLLINIGSSSGGGGC